MLFEEQVARKPNLYPWTQQYIDAIWASHWTPNEFNFISDKKQFLTVLTDEQRGVVVRTLSAIGQIEIAVKTFWARLGDTFRHPGLVDLGFVLAQNEVIHNQAYEKLLDELDLGDVFESNLDHPVIKARVAYLRKYLDKHYGDKRKQYIYALILFTSFVEDMSLFSQFAVISHINRVHGILKDTAQQVEYTRLEEQLHAQVGIKLVNTLRQEYPELFDADLIARVKEEMAEALAAEGRVIDWIMQGYEEPGLSADVLKRYIQSRMHNSLEAMGFEGPGRVEVPELRWMEEETHGAMKTDFFHKRSVDYGKSTQSFSPEIVFRKYNNATV